MRGPVHLRRLAHFIAVGAFVFVVDASVLVALNSLPAFTLFSARLISLPLAATIGWFLHRRVTFADRRRRKKARQWSHYLLVNVVSGTTNYGVYASLLALSPWMKHLFVFAVIPGAMSATLINFVCANCWVFR